ncbi:MAG: WYL domain-containing protein [Candidatus Sungbacteria bacterium]|uniref:WYL domain-containing protein n=1 Tax=Candidatus Sungiibacteriota bacterium TaxID=2750080 RepID=A0A932VQV6_9BACT|nr:WYL domain-containing protein [Candidatus Sungbacteria bacterium]
MPDTLVIDLETKKSFAEVGGEKNIRELGISVAGVYSYAKDVFFAFEEHELANLARMIKAADHLIGFNIIHFDIPVLAPYVEQGMLERVGVTDIFADAVAFLGHRVGLDGVAKATLGESKSGHGLEALEWFRQGRVEEVKKYCLDDVRLTRDLYEYGKKNGHVLFESYVDRKIHSIPVSWGTPMSSAVGQVLAAAYEARRRVAIEYISSQDTDQSGYRKARLIDIYHMKPNGEIEAYCHLRRSVRMFHARRIVKAEMMDASYTNPYDEQPALL